MKSILLFFVILMMSATVQSKETADIGKINASIFADGIMLEAENSESNLEITIAGPDNLRSTQTYSSNSVFLGINEIGGQELVDGLYKYEAWPTPAVTYSRKENSAMPDRNSLSHKTGPKVSSISGSFRVVNGFIADSELTEYDREELQ